MMEAWLLLQAGRQRLSTCQSIKLAEALCQATTN